MEISYFLGANSRDGFSSLYSGFAAGEGDRLHIIKGGPGTGKSGFMRKIGAEAEKRGLDVEYVLCSGDPDSLDGVYIPALKQGWVDGTAPHAAEPRCFGADSDYVNLGGFCRLPLSSSDAGEIRRMNRAYKALYDRAYAWLKATAAVRQGYLPQIDDSAILEAAENRVSGILRRHSRKKDSPGRVSRRYFSAISCRGELLLSGEIKKLCKLIYQLDDGMGLAGPALDAAVREGLSRGLELILCPSPLCPEETEMLLIPEASLALIRGCQTVEGARHVRLDALVPGQRQKELRGDLRAGRRLEKECMAAALEQLTKAKALHDRLEAVYRPYMDFQALTEFTDREICRIFSAPTGEVISKSEE